MEPAENHQDRMASRLLHPTPRNLYLRRKPPMSRDGRGAARYQSPCRATPSHASHHTRILATGFPRPSSPLLRSRGSAGRGSVRAGVARTSLLSPLS